MSFTNEEIVEYYNTTQNHYEAGWRLKTNLAMHYGIWYDSTKNLDEALMNTNRKVMELGGIKSSDRVLDAGCGVGGTSIFVHQNSGANVTGITLSQKQVDFGTKAIESRGISEGIDLQVQDFCKTTFADNTFDVIYAIESMCHAPNLEDFLKECYRILKPGGRLVVSDYFLTPKGGEKDHPVIRKWMDSWAMMSIDTDSNFEQYGKNQGFSSVTFHDFGDEVRKSSNRMYYGSMAFAINFELYNLTHPNVSRFAKGHYKSGIYQYKARKRGLWRYKMAVLTKS
ncbi:MAG: methyltransferase domain-containing protein [Flavobacteriia bacterium]|nr:methyltransferase domain-containing protein [Flavobacteriia bacterium]